jgi:hypothetical protein
MFQNYSMYDIWHIECPVATQSLHFGQIWTMILILTNSFVWENLDQKAETSLSNSGDRLDIT